MSVPRPVHGVAPRVGALLAALVLLAGCAGGSTGSTSPAGSPSPTGASAPGSPGEPGDSPDPTDGRPLAGRVVVLDPGHQLGNRRHGAEISRQVDAGGFEKDCNTTGTASSSGFPEATFTWRVALAARRILRELGARVLLTRDGNSDDAWGPCVDERGRIGNPGEPGPTADVRVSIHADGVLAAGARGFHVIRPGVLAGWNDDIERPSRRLAVLLRDALVAAGFKPSTYRGDRGLDVRSDLGTLNRSDVPTVMAELGNMRDDREAAVMRSSAGQRRYAHAIATAVRSYLTG